MKPRKNYIATRIVDGKFVALSNKGKLYAWDMITGKQLVDPTTLGLTKEQKVEKDKNNPYKAYKDYEVYEWKDEEEDEPDTVYRKEWYTKILLKKKTKLDKARKGEMKDMIQSVHEGIPFQVCYMDQIKKKFFEFKLIEIINEKEIKEHCSFVHTVYPEGFQYLYFSENL
jgi:hypothetical protein